MSEAQMKAVLEAYIAGLNARDADAVLALFAPDAEIEDPVGTPVRRGPELDAWFRGADPTQERAVPDALDRRGALRRPGPDPATRRVLGSRGPLARG
jgi:ketosteroid isomerase-like protein